MMYVFIDIYIDIDIDIDIDSDIKPVVLIELDHFEVVTATPPVALSMLAAHALEPFDVSPIVTAPHTR